MIPKLPHHLLEDVLEEIRIFVENIIESIGVHGHTVPVLRHVLLTLVAILLAFIAERICKYLFVPLVLRMVKRTQARWDDVVLDHQVLRTACHIVPALVIWQLMPLVFYQYHVVQVALTRITAVYLTVATTRLVTKLIDRLRYLNTKPGDSTSLYLKSFCGVLKILTIFIAAIVVVGILINRSPMNLLAGLGATSAILMLVFKDTIDGLVAGVRLTSNEMIHIGDWITLTDGSIDGTVQDITLTTVKVKQGDNSIATVSPQTLVNGSFLNWKDMLEGGGRRVKKVVYFDVRSIRIADDDLKKSLLEKGYVKEEELKGSVINIGLFRHYMEHYLSKREDVNPKMTLLLRQLDATQAGVPIEFYFFLSNKDWIPYEHSTSDILEHVYAYAHEFGLIIYEQNPQQ